MKILLSRILIALGLVSIFEGTSKQFQVHAKESSGASAQASDSPMGGKCDGCGKSQ